jgi:type IV pilus assembly protein PilC
MPVYHYTAIEASGARKSGKLTSASELELGESLKRSGLFLVEAKEQRAGPRGSCPKTLPPRVLSDLTERLEILVKAGFPLADALYQIALDTSHPGARAILNDLHDFVTEGQPLHKGLARHPQVFDDTYRAVVEAGEQSGALDDVLAKLAQKLLWRAQTRAQVRSALIYPAMVFTALGGLILLILLFLVPRISVIFEKAQVSPPASTLFLLAARDFVVDHGIALTLVAATLFAGLKLGYALRRFRAFVQEMAYRMPIFGRLFELAESAIFVQVLALLNSNGITISRALLATRDAVRTERMKDAIERVIASVTQGDTLSDSVKNAKAFPNLIEQLIAVGERSGALDDALSRAQRYLDREIPRLVGKLVAMLGPITTVLTGVCVGFAIFSVVSPLIAVLSAIRGVPK